MINPKKHKEMSTVVLHKHPILQSQTTQIESRPPTCKKEKTNKRKGIGYPPGLEYPYKERIHILWQRCPDKSRQVSKKQKEREEEEGMRKGGRRARTCPYKYKGAANGRCFSCHCFILVSIAIWHGAPWKLVWKLGEETILQLPAAIKADGHFFLWAPFLAHYLIHADAKRRMATWVSTVSRERELGRGGRVVSLGVGRRVIIVLGILQLLGMAKQTIPINCLPFRKASYFLTD